MLTLSRRPNQSVVIDPTGQDLFIGGHLITVTVLEVKGKQIKLGFSAPDSVAIHRSEIAARIVEEDLRKAADGVTVDG